MFLYTRNLSASAKKMQMQEEEKRANKGSPFNVLQVYKIGHIKVDCALLNNERYKKKKKVICAT